jgi:peroxiredoxin Q/BCP
MAKTCQEDTGVLRPTGTAERVTFIISPEGKIAKIIRNVSPRNTQ